MKKSKKLRISFPQYHRGLFTDVARICPHSERSLKRWLKAYREGGEAALVPKSTRPKSHPYETPIRVKERVIELRKETGLCAKKLHWRLKKEGVHIHARTIGKILKKEGLVRTYRTRRVKYTYVKAALQQGELVEIDVKYVPGYVQGHQYFQYTAIDCATRWRHLAVFDEQSTHHSVLFLAQVCARLPVPILAVKTDNHSVFTNWSRGSLRRSDDTIKTLHAFDVACRKRNIVHYLIDPGKPAQNGRVERSHREDEEKFYQQHTFRSVADLKNKLRTWNEYYNNLEHCALDGKTPNEVLLSKVPKVRT